jgi:hypothetical protein
MVLYYFSRLGFEMERGGPLNNACTLDLEARCVWEGVMWKHTVLDTWYLITSSTAMNIKPVTYMVGTHGQIVSDLRNQFNMLDAT